MAGWLPICIWLCAVAAIARIVTFSSSRSISFIKDCTKCLQQLGGESAGRGGKHQAHYQKKLAPARPPIIGMVKKRKRARRLKEDEGAQDLPAIIILNKNLLSVGLFSIRV